MVEQAAKAIHATDRRDKYTPIDWDEANKDRYRIRAAAALNALLPQVTTVAELEALPFRTTVLDSDGDPWQRYYLATSGPRPLRWRSAKGTYGKTSEWLAKAGPLTVVWTPEEGDRG